MKRLTVLFLIFALLFSACGSDTPAPAETEADAAESSEVSGGAEAVSSDDIMAGEPYVNYSTNFIFGLFFLVVVLAIGFGVWRSRSGAVLQEKLRQLREGKEKLEDRHRELLGQYESEREARIRAETEVKQQRAFIEDWQKQKQELIEASKAAALKSLGDMSSKLLNDHKSEAESVRKLGEKNLSDISRNLQDHFKELIGRVREFEGRLGDQESSLSTLKRVLSEPLKMGAAAEVILENHLKDWGLKEHQDFLLQHSFDTSSGRLRPDAVICLPDDYVVVVDSKSSGVLHDLAQAEGDDSEVREEDETLLYDNLKTAMRKHLRDLSGKEYLTAVERGIKLQRRSFRPKQIMVLMWVPSEGVLERIGRADSEFFLAASEKNIFVVGPSGLYSAIRIAAVKISEQKQNQNQALIIKETEILLQYITTALDHAASVGRAIRRTKNAYDKLAASVNGRLLPKAQHIVELGVNRPQGSFGKSLPSQNSDMDTIELSPEDDKNNDKAAT